MLSTSLALDKSGHACNAGVAQHFIQPDAASRHGLVQAFGLMRAVHRETIAKSMAAMCVRLLAAMLCFRAFFYSHMHLEPGAPMGASDLVELVLGVLLLLAVAGAALSAGWLALKGRRERRIAARVSAVVAAVVLSAGPRHSLVARWASG